MPYWSISEWRARIGSSWCSLGRPLKVKSTIKHGTRVIKKELTLNRVVAMMIMMLLLIGVNIGVRGLVISGHHHQLINWFEDLLGLLYQKVFTLTWALIFTSVLKISTNFSLKRSQWHSVIHGSYDSPLSISLLLYVMFLIVKMMYPAMNLIPWLALAVAVIHTPDMERVLTLLRVLINKRVEIVDVKFEQNGSLVTKRREDLRIQYLVNSMLDTTLSVAATVIASLLLLSGDIEQNPGPDLDYNSVDATQELDEHDLVEVLEAVLPIKSVYFALGQSLRLGAADLRSIKEKYPNESDDRQALSDTLELWLQKKYYVKKFGPPTWRMLVEAVNREAGGNNHELAKMIALKHPVTVVDTDGAAATQPPQPSEKETTREDEPLNPDNTREILDVTWPHRARWRLIGTELSIDTGTLDAIDANNKKVEGCLNELITGWLRKTNPRPTRVAITAVLNSEHILSSAAHDNKSATAAEDKVGEYTDYLTSLYKAKTQACYQDKDHWPPPVTNKVFRLAMIKAEKVEKGKINDEFVESTITGKVDDILRKKVPVELENIFGEVQQCEQIKVLMEGAPGCGKSTLSQHICYKWALGELFQQYKQVILVRLREPAVQNAKDVADMLPRRDSSMGAEIAKILSASDGQDILFVFDGWDELPLNVPGHSVIVDILNSTKLHKCSIIVTSRPVASMSILNLVKITSRIEILGFTKEELRQYFAGCLDNDNSKVVILQQRIQENPAVAGSCYLPLNASILVHLFKCGDKLPKTQFDIFSALICNCIYRHLKKTTTHQISAIQSLDKLPRSVADPFKQICEIAYEGVMEEKIIFDLEGDFNTLGLLQGVESFAIYGMLSRSYNFLHLSIQELLAAVHMATQLKDEQQVEQFTKLFGHPRFSAVFRFYAARTKLKTPGIKELVVRAVEKCLKDNEITKFTDSDSESYPDSDSNSDSDSQSHSDSDSDDHFNFGHEPQPLMVSLLHCLYEAQDKKLCQLVATELKQTLNLSDINLNPADCLSVGYILTYCDNFKVNLEDCNIGDDGCRTLFKQDGDYSGFINLDLGSNSISAEGALAISNPLKTMTNLLELSLHDNSLGDKGVKIISKTLKTLCTLQNLYLGRNSIGDEGALALSETLNSMTALRELYLFNNFIGNDGARGISEAAKTMTKLRDLDLHDNSISDDGAKEISETVKTLTNLKKLRIEGNFIGEAGHAALSAAKEQSGTEIYKFPQRKK